MNQREIRARIREIQRQIEALLREFNHLLNLLERGNGKPPGYLRIIPGGLAGIAILGTLATRIRRHPAALVGALTALGTAILVLVAPQGGTATTQQLSLPPAASVANSLATAPPTAPKASAAPTTPTTPTSPPAWIYLSSARPTPTTSGTAPAPTGATPTPSLDYVPAPSTPTSSRCIVEAAITGVLHLCVA